MTVLFGNFQVYAWSIVDIILAQKKNYNASYFAAQTMRQKVLYDFKELPKDSYIALRDSLINHLKLVFYVAFCAKITFGLNFVYQK